MKIIIREKRTIILAIIGVIGLIGIILGLAAINNFLDLKRIIMWDIVFFGYGLFL